MKNFQTQLPKQLTAQAYNNIIDAEKFYIPWLYDLAILEKHLLQRKTFRISFTARMPFPDGTDAYSDSVPMPDLFLIVLFANSFMEKGLKYLCLCQDTNTTFPTIRKYSHKLPGLWKHFCRLPESKSFLKTIRKEKLTRTLNAILRSPHPGLRYLDVKVKFTIDLHSLSTLTKIFKTFLLEYRRDYVYVYPQLRARLETGPNRHGGGFKALIPVKPGTQSMDWEKCTLMLSPVR